LKDSLEADRDKISCKRFIVFLKNKKKYWGVCL
jgi:hypothetical protein